MQDKNGITVGKYFLSIQHERTAARESRGKKIEKKKLTN